LPERSLARRQDQTSDEEQLVHPELPCANSAPTQVVVD
jgi:hypothetical protein